MAAVVLLRHRRLFRDAGIPPALPPTVDLLKLLLGRADHLMSSDRSSTFALWLLHSAFLKPVVNKNIGRLGCQLI